MKNIDIWIASFKKLSFLASKISCLSDKERQQADQFHFIKDKVHYELSHIFLRQILHNYYAHISPSEWKFSLTKYGKPYIINKLNYPINFTLSKSKSMVVLAFSTKYDIGIDIEQVTKLPTIIDFYNLVYTSQEQKLLYDDHDKKETFYHLWTLKEAYLKALGIGFYHNPLDINLSDIAMKLRSVKSFYKTPNYYYSDTIDNNVLSLVVLNSTSKIKINFKNF